jgi:hypothetical protein
MKSGQLARVIVLAVASIVTGLAAAAGPPALQTKSQGSITYVSGGVGDDQMAAMKALAPGFNLSLTFASAKTGEYLANSLVTIEDANGQVVLRDIADGPLFYVSLPPGRYTITAETDGSSQVRTVNITDRRMNRIVLYWGVA